MQFALAQINTTVGDIEGNLAKAVQWAEQAADAHCRLVAFPELTISGYPAEDLYLQPHFTQACEEALQSFAEATKGVYAVIGYPQPIPGAGLGPSEVRDRPCAHNCIAFTGEGKVIARYRKQHLPDYGVFDEARYFTPGNEPVVVNVEASGPSFGLTICEDCWTGGAPAHEAVSGGASLILNSSASPWYLGRGPERETIFRNLAQSLGRSIAVCNLVGVQDGLVFDGDSLVCAPDGRVTARAASFSEDLLIVESVDDGLGMPASRRSFSGHVSDRVGEIAELRSGLVLGIRDYVEKNRFPGVVLGLSGGIDSALVATLASEALGPERVTCIVMPSPNSSVETQEDARTLAGNLGTHLIELPISETMAGYDEVLTVAGLQPEGVTGENIQARIRGNLVMAVSNREGLLALTCGNKSEAAAGYATLYGDMAGGLAPIMDLTKTRVYELAHWINDLGAEGGVGFPIPAGILGRDPSAELAPGQRDSDTLPAYAELDPALEAHVEHDASYSEMLQTGIDPALAARVIDLVRTSEYKRKQAAPGIRSTPKAVFRDRRMPITNRYRSDSP